MYRRDGERLSFELIRRGITAQSLAERAGITEAGFSRARNGQPVRPLTLVRIVTALAEVPVLDGADLILTQPGQRKTAEASDSPAVRANGGHCHDQPVAR